MQPRPDASARRARDCRNAAAVDAGAGRLYASRRTGRAHFTVSNGTRRWIGEATADNDDFMHRKANAQSFLEWPRNGGREANAAVHPGGHDRDHTLCRAPTKKVTHASRQDCR
jgi:hypothetical protein